MPGRIEVIFPLELNWDRSFSITFTLQGGDRMVFDDGFHYLTGDNGSGKTSFINVLSLTAGDIGDRRSKDRGTVIFDGTPYNGRGFDHIRAAGTREAYFCIFPQKAYFLPVSTRDNYWMLNGADPAAAKRFSANQFPALLSGGQQQQILMDIVLDPEKPVWFLDEPLTHLDAERRLFFWKTLRGAYRKAVKTVFFIDHWMGEEIRQSAQFNPSGTLVAALQSRDGRRHDAAEFKKIHILSNPSPEAFFDQQIVAAERERERCA